MQNLRDRCRLIACATDYTKSVRFGVKYYAALLERVNDWRWLDMKLNEKQFEQNLRGESDEQ